MKRLIVPATRAAALALILIITGTATIGPAVADMQRGYPAKSLLSTGKTVVGETIQYPTSGPARVTAVIVTLVSGAKTLVHRHGVPLFAYILDGEVTVDYRGHGKRTFRRGDALIEAMSVAHHGINTGTKPVRILAVFMGAEGARNVVADQPQ